jgi:exodeoxyribonuclease VII large subunit
VALHRHRSLLDTTAGGISSGVAALARQRDHLGSLRSEIAGSARRAITRHGQVLEGLRDWFSAVDPDSTLTRGFAIVTTAEGSVVKSVSQVSTGDRLSIRLADGTVRVVVEGT